ncbi:MAG: hypothetical protein PVH21_03025 [Myxococcales bacterium]|jgi:hypothetical protein
MTYAEFYASSLQHPWLLWASALVGLLIALARSELSRGARWFCIVLTGVSMADAWLTADDVFGIGPLPAGASSWLPLFFVLVGDFRYFFFLEAARQDGTLVMRPKGVLVACAWTLVVPITSQVVVHAMGSEEPRVLFLVYEVLFVALALGLYTSYLPKHANAVGWTRRVTLFVLLYYASWAVADAIIVRTGADAGFLIRVVPNLLYYGGFVPAVAWSGPRA